MRQKRNRVIFGILAFCLWAMNMSAQYSRSLLVGISEYPEGNGWAEINGRADTDRLQPILEEKGFCVTKLNGEAATYRQIIQSLENLAAQTKTGDGVYIHFSCHGQPFKDEDGDEADGWDEALIPYDAPVRYEDGRYEGERHLLDDELNQYLNTIRKKAGEKGYLVVVIDACHAGTSYRGDNEEAPVRGTSRGFSKDNQLYRPSKLEKKGNYRIASGKDLAEVVILEACRPYQQNREIQEDNRYMGALSWYVGNQLKTDREWRELRWVNKVRSAMEGDIRLTKQNLVIESSLTLWEQQ